MKKSLVGPLSILSCLAIGSCQPPDDPVPPDISDQIERRYCNDPFAVNYNDSFPGIPDNDRCYYPYDLVSGRWASLDSVFKQDGEFIEIVEKELAITRTETEEKNKVILSNWCTGPGSLAMIVNKYGRIDIENTLEYPIEGQVTCGTDTLLGAGQYKVLDSDTTINFEFTEKKVSGQTRIHKLSLNKL